LNFIYPILSVKPLRAYSFDVPKPFCMKINNPFVLLAAATLLTLNTATASTNISLADTAKPHITDGNIEEWVADKFIKDSASGIIYAIDNDATNMYVAVKINNPRTQIRMMSMGTNMFIDVKGKKREGMGIEFPYRNPDNPPANFSSQHSGGDAPKQRPDYKTIRQGYALNLLSLKYFGFEGQSEEIKQSIDKEESISTAFNWDENDVMYIEYVIPMSFIGNEKSLKGKQISLGWKLNIPVRSTTTSSTTAPATAGGRGSGRGGGGGFSGSSGTPPSENSGSSGSSQNLEVWVKYDMKF
jgi:hypothetical protein